MYERRDIKRFGSQSVVTVALGLPLDSQGMLGQEMQECDPYVQSGHGIGKADMKPTLVLTRSARQS